ncbi:MAG TPA: glycosyltransferase family 4 protein [Candidatus Polarisedimenticolia bacterium]|nr:glycosyltransferase family 4 protein [Candidatus Polarisedimenticolia bacterium]
MRVLVLANATYADPPTRKVFDHVAAQGIEVMLAMPRRIIHPFGPSEVPPTPWPTPVKLELLDTWYLHENGTHVVMKGLPRLLRSYRPDVIHCVLEPWSLICLQVLSILPFLPGKRPLFGVHPCETKPEQGGWLASRSRQTLYRGVLSHSDYFVGWSSLAITAAQRLGLNAQPFAILPAVAVDQDIFYSPDNTEKSSLRSRLLGSDRNQPLIGYAGRLVTEKGVLDLVTACEVLSRTSIAPALCLLGDGPLSSQLRELSYSRPWMKLLPKTNITGVAEFLRAIDIFVLPSRTTTSWEEQFGLVLTQAMASGLAVVGSSSGAIPEVLTSYGRVYPEGDVHALSQALRSILLNRPPSPVNEHLSRFTPHHLSQQLLLIWHNAQSSCSLP